ncbi:unnamed protein product [Cylindrotheca closterium]|uniref:Uncharacterized protein n=1 Tax=Cylindrotheca closterium TaxID=2856 RepID=A0AAD2G8G9_9STRA|nr:unnamed protein product [Cylindrotheca closterium]
MNRILLIALLALSCVSSVTGNQRKFVRLARCFNDTAYPTSGDTRTCLGNVSTCFDDTTVETVKTCIQDGIAEARANNATDGDSRFLAGHSGGGGNGNGGMNNGNGGMNNGNGFGAGGGLGGFSNRTGFGSNGFRPQKKEKLGKLAGIVRGCLEEYKDCIKEEVRSFIKNKLPACVNTTAIALGECYKTNAETCSDSCSEDDIPDENPFQGVASSGIKSCNGFQNAIMNKACGIVDCCEECDAEFQDLMTCVGQDLLKLRPEPCELTCPAESTRRSLIVLAAEQRKQYVARKLAGHLATEPDAATVVEECAVYLDTEEETLTSDAVTELLLDGEFIGCVADVAILVAEEQKEFAMDHNDDSTSSGNSVLTISGLAAALLSLVGFLV